MRTPGSDHKKGREPSGKEERENPKTPASAETGGTKEGAY